MPAASRWAHAVDEREWQSLRGELVNVLVCTECHRTSGRPASGWKPYLTDDEPPDVAVFCPDCAEREFGGADS